MKNIKKLIAISIMSTSIFAINPVVAHAEWKQDNQGWHNTEGTTNSNNTTNLNSNNVTNTNLTTNSNNITNNINNGVIINGNVNIRNTTNGVTDTSNKQSNMNKNYNSNSEASKVFDTSDNPYTNKAIGLKQDYDGTNGFKEIEDNKYVYYENRIMLNNCWKEFEDGIRYFDLSCPHTRDFSHELGHA